MAAVASSSQVTRETLASLRSQLTNLRALLVLSILMTESMFSVQLRSPFVAESTPRQNIGSCGLMAKCVLSKVWVL